MPEPPPTTEGSGEPATFLVGSRTSHPIVWTVLYLPFGALGGFVSVALTFLATEHGLSISEGALLNGAQFLSQWLKWIWAPLVDITLSPRKWYVISTSLSALGVLAMSAVPLGPGTLGTLLAGRLADPHAQVAAPPRDHRACQPYQLSRGNERRSDYGRDDAP